MADPTRSGTSGSTDRRPALGAFVAGAALVLGCHGASIDPPDAAASPQANAEPAPLANVTAAGATTLTAPTTDSGPPPEALRPDRPLAIDTPREATREPGGKEPQHDPTRTAGYAMQAVLRTGEGPPAPKGPEVNVAAIEAARRKGEARMAIDLTPSRARFVLTGGFVLPQGTELRARADHYGHLVLWPGEDAYRIAEPGTLRGLLGERRLDVSPASVADVVSPGEGPRRLNLRTRRVDVTTRAAKATLELATLAGAGDGGGLVCRLLMDLLSAPPSTAVCGVDEVPLHAELHWTTQGALVFDATSVQRRTDLAVADLAAPPAGTSFLGGPVPGSPGEALLSQAELQGLRSGPIDLPPPQRDAQAPLAPPTGMVLVNQSDELRLVWIDAVPVAWVAPGSRLALPSLVRGHYTVQWRTFLGDAWDAPATTNAPGQTESGPEAERR